MCGFSLTFFRKEKHSISTFISGYNNQIKCYIKKKITELCVSKKNNIYTKYRKELYLLNKSKLRYINSKHSVV